MNHDLPTDVPPSGSVDAVKQLDELLGKLNTYAPPPRTASKYQEGDNRPDAFARLAESLPKATSGEDSGFFPQAPKTAQEAKISNSSIEELICKYLLAHGESTTREITKQIRLPFALCEHVVAALKQEQVLVYVGQAHANDYLCKLTDLGRERAKRYSDSCSYFGAAPVAYSDYVTSVSIQTITNQHPSQEDLEYAFRDLLISPEMLRKLGPAVNSGRGMFLYGFAGNGKTSIAERVTAAFGQHIWIPRAIAIDRDIIRLFDPMNHEEVPLETSDGLVVDDTLDLRWVRIKRPTIVVGGEMKMDHLELQYNPTTGISEAPIQMKSNCGTLLIDDFGRQQMTVDELLNRWIVPLEKRYDYLNTSCGKKIQMPFDQLVIFSTNLEPRDLVDDAFLRRIPYKIEVPNPSREYFVKLFEIMCGVFKCNFDADLIDQLIERHYIAQNRPFRNCHPRDLLLQIRNMCHFEKKQFVMTVESLDFAVDNYFSIL